MAEQVTFEVLADPDAVAAAAAERVVAAAAESIAARGVFHLALAGGSTPKLLYSLLAASPLRDRIDWPQTEIWFGDERCVPPDDPSSNYRMAREALLDHVPAPGAAVHRIRGELLPAEGAASYASELDDLRLDVVLLGMGGDGHTASLFPQTEGLDDDPRLVRATTSPIPPADRISLTLTAINAARQVLFLVTGAGKAEMVARVRAGDRSLPAARVAPTNGILVWLVDEATPCE